MTQAAKPEDLRIGRIDAYCAELQTGRISAKGRLYQFRHPGPLNVGVKCAFTLRCPGQAALIAALPD